ncbi:MAG TPA: bifunctional glutamate N-acetyltransferase/amino-acid acetyltransferase ArgJ [Terriglobales bacterium]|jgi:glutamate N-acetyltransferase/amino-acid N-acetyltransferase|nr:bifunctional glutamate N-acetyltransferase/amino-acid acetyltransferase ArgJ [Terriglobales bacterium]
MTAPTQSPNTIHLPKGFSFSALAAGIKASGRLDLALVEAAPGTIAAALFTRNLVVAAPVEVARTHLSKAKGHIRAVIVNSGNANCATGKAGLKACEQVCKGVAKMLNLRPQEVFPSSTGIIGVPLRVEKIIAKLPELAEMREPTSAALDRFTQAIMTTDTRQKSASARFNAGASEVGLLGVAKGAGMIHPQLATMLVYLFTDIAATSIELRQLLRQACDQSFNCISIDGDTSTNDTVLLLASGQSGIRLKDAGVRKKFANALSDVCRSLAEQIIADGEGVQHVIHLFIEQAKSRQEALQVARTIAHSLLVKTAWAGADPNWGRILAAVGRSGIALDPNRVSIYIAKQMVCKGGVSCQFDEAKAHQDLAHPSCDIRVRLGRGQSGVEFITTDLTAEYVRINADYST